jgi:hypothetical protein
VFRLSHGLLISMTLVPVCPAHSLEGGTLCQGVVPRVRSALPDRYDEPALPQGCGPRIRQVLPNRGKVPGMRRMFFLALVLFAACSPKTTSSPIPELKPREETVQSPLARSQMSRPNPALVPSIDRSTCGLPEEIRRQDWPRHLAPTERRSPEPLAPGAFTFAVLPDTQYYASCREKHLRQQTAWVARHWKARNMVATIQLGDLTEHNTPDEWEFVKDALSPLNAAGPLFLATGNHDYGEGGSADRRHTLFSQYFGRPPEATRKVVAESMDPTDVENAYYRVPVGAAVVGVLILEWSPRIRTVSWAREMLKKYPGDKKIFVTHAYLFHDGTRYDWAGTRGEQEWNPREYGTARSDPSRPAESDNWSPEGAYDGEMLWQEFLVDVPGLFLTLSGHVLGDGAGHLSSDGRGGNRVHQVLTNFQMLDEGGLGYLRLIEIDAQGETMKMRTFSPSLGLSATAADQQFDLKIEPPLFE